MTDVHFVELGKLEKLQASKSQSISTDKIIKAKEIDPHSLQPFASFLKNEKKPKIELKKKNDRVERIEVNCTCGKKLEIFLDYGDVVRGDGKLIQNEKRH